jgi:hypothetical protein
MTEPQKFRPREVAKRVFLRELSAAKEMIKNEEDQYAPSYLQLPTGDEAARVFVVGTLIELEDIGKDSTMYKLRIVDPTGSISAYAGDRFQAEVVEVIEKLAFPSLVAVVAKPNLYESPSDGKIITSLRIEQIGVVDQATRLRWIRETLEATNKRIFASDAKEWGGMCNEVETFLVEQLPKVHQITAEIATTKEQIETIDFSGGK